MEDIKAMMRTNFVHRHDALPIGVNKTLYQAAIDAHYQRAQVTTGDLEFRKAYVCFDWKAFSYFWTHAREAIASAITSLDPDFEVPTVFGAPREIQLTATMDEQYFRPHQDNGVAPIDWRRFSFVYYVHNDNFEGGLLHFTESGSSIEPVNNSLIVFRSELWHEIELTKGPHLIDDARITVNGWL